MEKLLSAIENLKNTVKNNRIDADFIETKKKIIEDLKLKLSISSELINWYKNAGPLNFEIDWSVEWLLLYPPDELIDYQIGYRWLDDEKMKVDKNWKEKWIAIGDCSGDPIIADVAKENTPILMAVHGTGIWSPSLIAPSLEAYLNALAVWIQLTNTQFKGKIRLGDVFNQELKHALKENLNLILTSDYLNNFLKFFDNYFD